MSPLVHDVFARETGALETAAWVPPLFAAASVVIGMGHVLGDDLRRATPLVLEKEGGAPGETETVEAPPPVREQPPKHMQKESRTLLSPLRLLDRGSCMNAIPPAPLLRSGAGTSRRGRTSSRR